MLKSRGKWSSPCSIYHVLSFYWRLGGRNEYWRVGRNFLIVFLSGDVYIYPGTGVGGKRCCESIIALRILINPFDRERAIFALLC